MEQTDNRIKMYGKKKGSQDRNKWELHQEESDNIEDGKKPKKYLQEEQLWLQEQQELKALVLVQMASSPLKE